MVRFQRTYWMRAALGVLADSSVGGALEDGGLADEGGSRFFLLRSRRRDLTLLGCLMLWLLRRWATLTTGPVAARLKVNSDLKHEDRHSPDVTNNH